MKIKIKRISDAFRYETKSLHRFNFNLKDPYNDKEFNGYHKSKSKHARSKYHV